MVEDMYAWNYDGNNIRFRAAGILYGGAAPVGFTQTADDADTSQPATGAVSLAREAGRKYIASQYVPTATASIGRIQLRLYKTGAPTYNLTVGIYSDTGAANNAGKPLTLVGTGSATLAASFLTTAATGVLYDFYPNTGQVQLTAGVPYWIVLGAPDTYVTQTFTADVTGTGNTITSTGYTFTTADVGRGIGTNSAGFAASAYITAISTGTNVATISSSGTVSTGASVQLSTGNYLNYVSWSTHLITAGPVLLYKGDNATTWSSINSTQQTNYISYK